MVNLKKYGIDPLKKRDYENVAYVMALIYNMSTKRINKFFRAYGVTLQQFNVLMAVRFQNEGKGLNQKEIGSHLIVSPGSITRLTDNLMKEKMLVVSQNKNNRRENIVKITPKGRNFIETVWPGYDRMMREIVDLVPKANQAFLSKVLSDWLEALTNDV
ncbi:MAG: MarR family transcriptional regulator [Syntrophobacterales bacterium]|jgi:DNA-binding MarR family transcriptional regulator|nr:MarR family transcriptional regulator [Syntrophobacterales bacterium]